MAWLSEFNRLEWDSDEELTVCRYCEAFSMHSPSSLAKECDNFTCQMVTKHLPSKSHINCRDWYLEIWQDLVQGVAEDLCPWWYSSDWNLPQGRRFNFRSLWSNLISYQLTLALICHGFVLCGHAKLMNCLPHHNETKDRYHELIKQKQWLPLRNEFPAFWEFLGILENS